MSVVEYQLDTQHISHYLKTDWDLKTFAELLFAEKFFEAENKKEFIAAAAKSVKYIEFILEQLEQAPHPQVVGGVANYGIKLWGTNAAFFVPQGAAGVHAAPPPPHPPSAAAPPGVHAQVAQNGTVYYHQPVRKVEWDYGSKKYDKKKPVIQK